MAYLSRVAALLVLLLMAGCRRPESAPAFRYDPSAFDGRRALQEVEKFVALGPRAAGTPGADTAARHILERLREIGVEVTTDEFTDTVRSGTGTFRNVVGRIAGAEGGGVVLLACHYDTKSGIGDDFQGANDSGSGVGVVLELARTLRAGPKPPHDILFAFLDGEECVKEYSDRDGLHGSRRLAKLFVRNRGARRVRGVIVLDMVGDRDLSVTLPRNGTPELIAGVFDAAREESVRDRFALSPGVMIDDHVPFLEADMPAVDIVDFEYGSAPGRNDYWHTAHDTMDKLSADSMALVGRVVIRTMNGLMR